MTWHESTWRCCWRGCALLLVTLTILAGCASFPSAGGAQITDIDQIAGKWAGTINPGVQRLRGSLLPDHHTRWKAGRGLGSDHLLGTVTIRNGQATFEMQPPISEGTIRLYLDGSRRTLFMDGVLPSFSAQVTPQG